MAQVSHVLARLRQQPLDDLPFDRHIDQHLRQTNHLWRERLLPPLLTLRLFVLQVLHGNVAIAALRQLAGIGFSPSSYCEARERLPLHLVQSLISWLAGHGREAAGIDPWVGPRILIADGSGCSTPDTPQLRDRLALPAGQKPGVGYPAVKLMGLLDAATGMFLRLLALPLFQHDMRSVTALHPILAKG